jgi:hypothetical protein
MNDHCKPKGLSGLLGFFKDVVTLVRGLTFLPLLLGLVLVAATPAWPAPASLPAGVPNIYDPGVLEQFQPAGVGNLRDNPDFPVLLLVNTMGEQPQALLLGLDARNGTEAWSLTADPVILIVLFSDQTTIQEVYVDAGFVDLGRASGNYAAVGEESLPALPDLLEAVTAPAGGTGVPDSFQEASPTLPVTVYSSSPQGNR